MKKKLELLREIEIFSKLDNKGLEVVADNIEIIKYSKGTVIFEKDTASRNFFIEQGFNVLRKNGNLNYIVPMAITSSDAMTGLHNILENSCNLIRVSSYSNRPKQIFDNACIRTSIWFFIKTLTKNKNIYTTRIIRRKYNDELSNLISNLQFINSSSVKLKGRYPKISTTIELNILKKMFNPNKYYLCYIPQLANLFIIAPLVEGILM